MQPELSATTQNGVQNRSKPFKTFQTRVNWEKDPARIERYDRKRRPKPVKTVQNRPDPHQLKRRIQPELSATNQNGVQNRSKPPGPASTERRIQPKLNQNGVQNRSKPFKTARTRTNSEKDPARTERYDPKWRPKPVKTVQNRPDPRQLREGFSPN